MIRGAEAVHAGPDDQVLGLRRQRHVLVPSYSLLV
jgi:hypothetical protein